MERIARLGRGYNLLRASSRHSIGFFGKEEHDVELGP